MYCYCYCSFEFIVIVIVAAIVHVIVGVHPKPCGSRTHGRESPWLSMYAPFDPDARMVVLANGEVLSIVIVPPYSGVNGRVQKRHKASDSVQNYFVCPSSSPPHVCKVWRHSDAPLRRADLPKTAP